MHAQTADICERSWHFTLCTPQCTSERTLEDMLPHRQRMTREMLAHSGAAGDLSAMRGTRKRAQDHW